MPATYSLLYDLSNYFYVLTWTCFLNRKKNQENSAFANVFDLFHEHISFVSIGFRLVHKFHYCLIQFECFKRCQYWFQAQFRFFLFHQIHLSPSFEEWYEQYAISLAKCTYRRLDDEMLYTNIQYYIWYSPSYSVGTDLFSTSHAGYNITMATLANLYGIEYVHKIIYRNKIRIIIIALYNNFV